MQNGDITLPFNLYSERLETISNVKFSFREVDILACVLNGRSVKGIAQFLSISPHTVETHIRNILRKIECGSRDGIIKFIEDSDKHLVLKKYYSGLLSLFAFEQTLTNISKLIKKNPSTCLIIHWQKKEESFSLIQQLSNHLKQVGLIVTLERRQGSLDLFSCLKETHNVDVVFYCLPKDYKDFSSLDQEKIQVSPNILFLQLGQNHSDSVLSIEKGNYYFSFFKILKRVFPEIELYPLIENFKKKYQNSEEILDLSPLLKSKTQRDKKPLFSLKNWRPFFLVLLFLALGGMGSFLFFNKSSYLNEKEDYEIRADLNIPTKSVLLARPHLIAQIEKAFKGKEEIHTVALVGIGGAGKTTLARIYAHSQQASIIWEVNAETPQSLKASFEDFAHVLATTEEDKKNIRVLQEIRDSDQREKQFIRFVKDHLRSSQNWLLVYDNVDKMDDITAYFPSDFKTWGQGNIILTTRDSTIKNNKNVTHTIQIEELTEEEKLELFSKILYESNGIQPASQEILKSFLEEVPSFPLDVSVAAYYLKTTGLSFENYLDRLKQNHKDFEDVQQSLLKEAGDYDKTRYNVITLSLRQLIDAHPDFQDLLLLISLVDSQNIPRDFLDTYKDKEIVDSFIYNLNKYSIVLMPSDSFSKNSTFSIHRSTQAIVWEYLKQLLALEKSKELLLPILESMEQYGYEIIQKEDIPRMKILRDHLISFLKHKDFLSALAKGYINSELGSIFNYLGDYARAENYFKQSLAYLKKYTSGYPTKVAWAMEQLGEVYSELGNNKNAVQLFEKALLLYRKDPLNNHSNIARATANVSYVYKEMGDYNHSEELLKESLILYKKYDSKNHVGIAWVLLYLGYLYQDLGYYEKAKDYYAQSLTICKKNLPKDHILNAWVLSHLGNMYRELGNKEKAKLLVNEGLLICKNHFSENHVGCAVILSHLGKIHEAFKNYSEANAYYKKSNSVYRNHYPEDHVRIARTLRNLSKLSLLEEREEEAVNFLNQALCLFEKNKHPEIYTILEDLAELSLKKSLIEEKKENALLSQELKARTLAYLNQALEIAKSHFPENSPHKIKIEAKIKDISK